MQFSQGSSEKQCGAHVYAYSSTYTTLYQANKNTRTIHSGIWWCRRSPPLRFCNLVTDNLL